MGKVVGECPLCNHGILATVIIARKGSGGQLVQYVRLDPHRPNRQTEEPCLGSNAAVQISFVLCDEARQKIEAMSKEDKPEGDEPTELGIEADNDRPISEG